MRCRARIDIHALEAANPLADVVARFCGPLRQRAGRELVFTCPFGNHTKPKLSVNPDKGVWCCFACDVSGSGSIDFVKAVRNCNFLEAAHWLGGDDFREHRIDPQIQARVRKQEQRRREREAKMQRHKAAWCLEVLAQTKTAETFCPVGLYLSSRGLSVKDLGDPLRGLSFHPHAPFAMNLNTERLPAMVARIRRPARGDRQDRPKTWSTSGCHVTYLREDSEGDWTKARIQPAKKMFGGSKGGAIRLGPARKHLYLTEGIETGLAVHQLVNKDRGPDDETASVWAVGSIAGFGSVCLPSQTEQITICADNDNKDPVAAKQLIERAASQHAGQRGVRIAYPDAGCDWLDMLTGEVSL